MIFFMHRMIDCLGTERDFLQQYLAPVIEQVTQIHTHAHAHTHTQTYAHLHTDAHRVMHNTYAHAVNGL